MEHPITPAVLIVIEPQRLLARVALGRRMRLVTADLIEAAAALPAEPDQDPAVAFAEDAGARAPRGYRLGPSRGAHDAISWAGGPPAGVWCKYPMDTLQYPKDTLGSSDGSDDDSTKQLSALLPGGARPGGDRGQVVAADRA